jgi:hypothetical protein
MCSAELRCQDDAGDEGEDGAEGVEDDQEDGEEDGLDEEDEDAVEPDDPAEGCDEHGVVDGGVRLGLAGENIANEGCDDHQPDELDRAQNQLSNIHGGRFGDIARLIVAIRNWSRCSRCSSSTCFEGSEETRQWKRRGEEIKFRLVEWFWGFLGSWGFWGGGF